MLARSKARIIVLLLTLGVTCISASSGASLTLLATSVEPRINLSADPIRVPLIPLVQGGANKEQPLEFTANKRIYLVLDGITADLPPGANYDVFLGPPDGNIPPSDNLGYAGTLNFFDISAQAESHSVSYDVTDVLMRLRQHGQLAGPIFVTFVPDAPPFAKAKPAVGRLSLVAQ
jgi:hypothetical protein